MTFGEKLKQLRLDRDLSQQDLANILGTSKQVISRYELGQTTPKIDLIANWCIKLGINPANLLIDTIDLYDTISETVGIANRNGYYYFYPDEDNGTIELTPTERQIITAYREHPELQYAVNKLLGVNTDATAVNPRSAGTA